MDKQQLRQQIKTQLCKMTDSRRQEANAEGCRRLVDTPQFKGANTIMAFLSLPHEIDTAQFILCAWQHNKTIAVPKISWQQRHMIPVQINSLETGIATEAGGLKNPVTGIPVPLEDIDLVITPALAIDGKGNRLGRGGAYYDRFFENENLKAVKCGFIFSEQLVEDVPVAEHDKKLDMIVTDKEVISL